MSWFRTGVKEVARVIALLALAGCGSFGSPSGGPAAKPGNTVTSSGNAAAPGPSAAPADTTGTRYQEALALMKARDYARAEPLLLDLAQKNPQVAGPHANLGILYARTRRAPPAIESLRRAVALNPKLASAQNELGILLRQTGDLRGAEQAYLAALTTAPAYALAHLNLGVLYDVHLKQPARALPHYEQYQKLAPADAARVGVWIAELKQRTTATR
jgi:tetratricopeptide (TPR) repeat protein